MNNNKNYEHKINNTDIHKKTQIYIRQHRYTQDNIDIHNTTQHRYTQVENITIQVSNSCVK
jgi:hypothetical protein